MTWLRIEDRFPRHRRIRGLRRDTAAKWLHVCALCYCSEHLTDGHIDQLAVDQIVTDAEIPKTAAQRCINKLVNVGLWIQWTEGEESGFLIRDFLDYNPAKEAVKQRREATAERQARWRDTHRDNASGQFVSNASRNALRNALVTPPRPVPIERTRSSALGDLIDESLRSAQ